MFARLIWKAGLGAALLMLSQCREAEAAKTPDERAREVVELLVAGKYSAVQQMFSQEMKDGLTVTALIPFERVTCCPLSCTVTAFLTAGARAALGTTSWVSLLNWAPLRARAGNRALSRAAAVSARSSWTKRNATATTTIATIT